MMARNVNRPTSGNASSTHHKSRVRKSSPEESKKDPVHREEQTALHHTTESGHNRSAADSVHAPSRSDKSKKPDHLRKLKSTITKLGKMLREKQKHRFKDVATLNQGLPVPHIESYRKLPAPADTFHSAVGPHEPQDQAARVFVGQRLDQQRRCSFVAVQRTERRSEALLGEEKQQEAQFSQTLQRDEVLQKHAHRAAGL